MKTIPISLAVLALLAAAPAFAEDSNHGSMPAGEMHGGAGMGMPGMGHGMGDMEHGSSTMQRPPMGMGQGSSTQWSGDHMGSSTMPGMRMGSTSMMMPPGIIGVVAGVSDNSFTLTARLKDATTTLTVNVSSTTMFHMGSTTASLSSLTAGERVVVIGPVSSSTQTVAARMVIIGQGEMMGEGMGDHMASGTPGEQGDHASSTPRGIINWFKNLFGRHGGEQGQSQGGGQNQSSGGPAAAASSGIGLFLHTLFGWF